MKLVKLLFGLILLVAINSEAQSYSYTNPIAALIPDGNPAGLMAPINVAGVPGEIANVTVSLTISGGFNGDFFAYLSGENGGYAVLLNRVGKTGSNPLGYSDAGMSLTLSDAATTDIHVYGGNSGAQLTGTWQPDGRNFDPQLVLDTTSRTASFNSFDNLSPNGQWTLFVADLTANGTTGTLENWELRLELVPEPTCISILSLSILLFLRHSRKHRGN